MVARMMVIFIFLYCSYLCQIYPVILVRKRGSSVSLDADGRTKWKLWRREENGASGGGVRVDL